MKSINTFVKCYVVIFILAVATLATAHEGGPDKFVHQVGTSGPMVGLQLCGLNRVLRHYDTDKDGALDRCTLSFLSHGNFHITPAKLVNGECTCESIARSE